MTAPQLPLGIANGSDSRTIVTTVILVVAQLLVCARAYHLTLRVLGRGRSMVDAFRSTVSGATHVNGVVKPDDHRPLARAWRLAYVPRDGAEVLEPEEAFDPERLIPLEYNARLDNAAPGLFTALGIIGTFAGLILAFWQIDPTNSEGSIGTLIGGMKIAFINSLLGVFLSIAWTWLSRTRRYNFDRACRELADIAERRFGRHALGTQMLARLSELRTELIDLRERAAHHSTEQVEETRRVAIHTESALDQQRESTALLRAELTGLQEATRNSSRDLLDRLAPQLEQSFKALIDTPFERLTESVSRFENSVTELRTHHETVLERLTGSAEALHAAHQSLEGAVTHADGCVDRFGATLESLGEQAAIASTIVENSKAAAQVLAETTSAIQNVGERHGQLASALGGAVTELRGTAGSLQSVAGLFETAAGRLDAAVANIERAGRDTVAESMAAARAELQSAVDQMGAALRQFGDASARAYEDSTGKVIRAVDGRMSDLTDRMSAELATLAARLPEAMQDMTQASREIRQHMLRAVKSLDDAVRQLDAGTRKALTSQLTEYDEALAKAVDHFSGTLANWDGRVSELGSVSRELTHVLQSARSGPTPEHTGNGSAIAAIAEMAPVGSPA